MGIKRYVTLSNWYSTKVILFLERNPEEEEPISIKAGHKICRISYKNILDSQSFDSQKYANIYAGMLQHGDIGYFGYINGLCKARCWGRVRPDDYLIYGENMDMDRNGVYLHYVKTAMDARRVGLAKECLSNLIADNYNRKIYVTVDLMNEPSLHLHKNLGFKETAIIIVNMRAMKEKTRVHWLC